MEASPVGISTAGTRDHGPCASSASGAVREGEVDAAHPPKSSKSGAPSLSGPEEAIGMEYRGGRRRFANPCRKRCGREARPDSPSSC